jgi:uncharacterized membrane protein HdeD (DUF308 family)
MITVAHTWWAAMLRGAAALALALIVAVHVHDPATGAPLLFGMYALVDGVIAMGGVLAAGLGRCGALLLTEGLAGITIGMASIYEPHAAPLTTPLFMTAWAVVIGGAEIFTGGQVGCEMRNFRDSSLLDKRLLQRTLAPNRAYRLSGAVALAFAVALAVVPIFRTTLAIPLLGLFAASFGYLHLCVGLILGLHVMEQSSFEGVVPTMQSDLGATAEGALWPISD